ncbi:hypothetical protein GCM10025872_12770 [Barrientosiimonas endolithica]|uniref:Alanine racemase N-terminal domain-containing protein n=1 Tax=Barrientosiimonas endolithica TaxID=1535208 RepID=A0ABN6YNQ2_9MICO|nr:hypothetical protein GCM10025872_12770 [Barrientosiimonas endolithica]
MTERRDELAVNLQRVRERIDAACADAGRSPEELTLVVVTKFFPASDVALLADLGVTDVAENRHQEAGEKVASLDPDVRRRLAVHFVGQLQSNKAAAVTRYADVVQSVDRAKIARALDRAADERDHPLEVTVQVDLSGDDAGRGECARPTCPPWSRRSPGWSTCDCAGSWRWRRWVPTRRRRSPPSPSSSRAPVATTPTRPGCRPG